ncbi:unnamed protein product, partial [Phaeothamnion confervicola]
LPGYSGFVPASETNIRTAMGEASAAAAAAGGGARVPPRAAASSLVYRHNVPGYTGHEPRAVSNDRGPR